MMLFLTAVVVGPSGCHDGKAGEALAVASVAAAMTVAEMTAARRADYDVLRTPSAGCSAYGQVECYEGPALTLDEARDHALFIVNHVRVQNGLPPLALDYALTAFAQEGSKQLLRDHIPHAHIGSDPTACIGCAELQGDPDGYPVGPVEGQIDGILDKLVREGPGGKNHDVLTRSRWHRIGIGIANFGGPMFLTIDVGP